uniref:Protein-serine/threonine kinase n=1 Tax=Ascaris lumbricoides TaxID=6252 RepID=A0A0M3ISG9_ASCLU
MFRKEPWNAALVVCLYRAHVEIGSRRLISRITGGKYLNNLVIHCSRVVRRILSCQSRKEDIGRRQIAHYQVFMESDADVTYSKSLCQTLALRRQQLKVSHEYNQQI